MRCPKCGGNCVSVQTYKAGRGAQSSRRVCKECSITFTVITMVIAEDPAYGEGASVVAPRLAAKIEQVRAGVRTFVMEGFKRKQSRR